MESYLAAIDQYHGAYRTSFARYVTTGLGFDTNVNNATDRGAVTASPAAGGLVFALANDSRELDSTKWDIGAGFSFTSPLQSDLRLVGGIDFNYSIALRDSDFTTTHARGHTGFQLTRDQNQYSLIVQGEKYFVDGPGISNSDRQLGAAVLQWRHIYNDNTQVSLFGQAALIRYPEQQVRNVNRYSGGVGVAHAMPQMAGSPVIFASAFGGVENSQNDRARTGLRLRQAFRSRVFRCSDRRASAAGAARFAVRFGDLPGERLQRGRSDLRQQARRRLYRCKHRLPLPLRR